MAKKLANKHVKGIKVIECRRMASSLHTSLACFLVPTNKKVPPLSAIDLTSAYEKIKYTCFWYSGYEL